MALIATKTLDRDGEVVDFTVASASDTFKCGAQSTLLVRNDDTVSHDVVLVTPGTVDGLAVADRTVSVAAGTIVGLPADVALYADVDGIGTVTAAVLTGMKYAVILR